MTRNIRPPNDDENFMRDVINRRKNRSFSDELYDKIYNLFSHIEHNLNEVDDFAKHILETDIDTALEDSVGLFGFFGLQANAAESKEKYFFETLKTLEAAGVKNQKEKVISQKGEVRSSKTYRDTQKAYLKFRKIRKDCEHLTDTMGKRLDAARSRSVNRRTEQSSQYLHKG